MQTTAGSLWLPIGLLASALLFLFIYLSLSSDSEHRRLEAGLESQLSAYLQGRVDVLSGWFQGQAAHELRFVENRPVRMIAAEIVYSINQTGADSKSLAARFRGMLDDFARDADYDAVYLTDHQGRVAVASSEVMPLPSPLRALPMEAIPGNLIHVSDNGDLQHYRIIGVPALQPQTGADEHRQVALLITGQDLAQPLQRLLRKPAGLLPGGSTYLFAPGTNGSYLIDRSGRSIPFQGQPPLGFRRVTGVSGESVYSQFLESEAGGWGVLVEAPAALVDGPLLDYQSTRVLIGLLISLLLAGGLFLMRFRHARATQAILAEYYQAIAHKREVQKNFLDSINAATPDLIGVKNRQGRFIYANPALLQALGKPLGQLPDSGDRQLFPGAIGERVADLTGQAALGITKRDNQVITLAGERHYLLSAMPLAPAEADVSGVMLLAKDVTELHRLQLEKDRSTENTIAALVATIEHRDPYLKGQTGFTRQLASGIATKLKLDPEAAQGIRQAALLSQIGKSFIPESLAAKPERLNEKELESVRAHIRFALDILEPLELPDGVMTALAQMYERLDGSGFPQGLKGDQIGLPGRLLGVADIITARALPRSYRQKIDVRSAVRILLEHPQKYDRQVVEAADTFLESDEGEQFLREIAAWSTH